MKSAWIYEIGSYFPITHVMESLEPTEGTSPMLAPWAMALCLVAMGYMYYRSATAAAPAHAAEPDAEAIRAARLSRLGAAPAQPGDLSQCPRWQRLRQRILEKAQRADA